jgi:hypothetical protein
MSTLLVLSLLSASPGSPSFDAPSPPVQSETAQPEVHHAWGLSVFGGAVGVASWIASVIVYAGSTQCPDYSSYGEATQVALTALGGPLCTPQASPLTMLPLIGPWLALTDPATAHAGLTGVTAAVGVAQLVALSLCIAGPLIRIDAPHETVAMTLAPGAGTALAGLSLAGRF